MSSKLIDQALARYYKMKTIAYYDNENIGKFYKWCQHNEYDTNSIAKEIKKSPDQCRLVEFDTDFPTNKIGKDRTEEIFKIIEQCYNDPHSFLFEIVNYQQTLLFDGYFRKQIFIHINHENIPIDIINLCLLFFVIPIESLYNTMSDKYTKQKPNITAQQLKTYKICKLASQTFNNGEYYVATQIYIILLSVNDHNDVKATLHSLNATALQKWNVLSDAEDNIKSAIKLRPNADEYKFRYGYLLFSQQKYESALKQLLDAIKLNHKVGQYYIGCAKCYNHMKDYENATKYHLKAIEIEPKKEGHYIQYAEYLCRELSEFDAAKIHFIAAIELNPTKVKSYYIYGKHLRDYIKDYNESEINFKKCLEINDKYDGVHTSYGYLLFLMGQYEKANEYLKNALQFDDNKCWNYYYWSLVNKTLGNEIKANELILKAVESCPKSMDVEFNVKRLKIADPNNIEYHEKFGQMIQEKLDEKK